ncbi:tRNA1Val (adenine37-N6)-methyltransferase [Gillisia sp. Hel_I_86]|uniref:tRNA1(Val) (adenine(37)-N6)-methyltransferase n=1 Tax=Gillisia sp. Hel_I_86 TaxID=1249981 RepID=UPI001199B4AC|nr:methyltransferase [Gillisia sp. Hel_I_86]TVZ25879.1 tRNA1Val (adenine37-N6)-methyltransferase [Gillisia sp. Hel_I_86]
METPFRFKEFSIAQDKCAMKIGTDGVLLGAWTPISPEVNSILDIGAGTGIIALMLAQRSAAETIDALEIDEDAYEQAVGNFENSPWGDRLFCYHAAFDEFVEEMQDEKYDLIVSNPPFFANTTASENATSRETARSQASLPFEELLQGVSQLLSENGTFSIIIPKEEESAIVEIASINKLYPNKITEVKGTAASKVKRSLITFQFLQKEIERDLLILEESRHKYTPQYKKMVAPFYLKL